MVLGGLAADQLASSKNAKASAVSSGTSHSASFIVFPDSGKELDGPLPVALSGSSTANRDKGKNREQGGSIHSNPTRTANGNIPAELLMDLYGRVDVLRQLCGREDGLHDVASIQWELKRAILGQPCLPLLSPFLLAARHRGDPLPPDLDSKLGGDPSGDWAVELYDHLIAYIKSPKDKQRLQKASHLIFGYMLQLLSTGI